MGPIEISQCSGLEAAVLSFWIGADSAHPGSEPFQMRMRMGGMRRREILAGLWGAAVALPAVARAQQSAKLPTIGYLGPNTRSLDSQRLAAFVQRLRELGWIDDRTITIEYRWADGRNEHLAEFAADFVRQEVGVIVTSATAHRCGKTGNICDSIVFAC